MSGPEIKFSVGDLDAGGKQYTFPLRAAWMRGILEDHEATTTGVDGLLDIRASRSGNDVVIHGTLKAELEVPCARCLTPVPLPIDETLSLLFVPGKVTPPPLAPKEAKAKPPERPKPSKKRAEPEEYELAPEDADTFPYDGEVVVLDDVIRDELILETPIFPLCSEDCAGMSPPPDVAGKAAGSEPSSSSGSGGPPGVDTIDPRLLPLLRLKSKPD